MHNISTAHYVEILMALLMVASAVGAAVKWVKVPYSIALVIVGLCIGSFHLLPPVVMTPELILLVCLPALLFEASWNLDLKELLRNWRAVLLLAVPGVIITMLVSGVVLHSLTPMSWPLVLLFGAITAATDPISVLALFRQSKVDHRLSLILEAESLFNDGTAVVLFKIMLAAALVSTGTGGGSVGNVNVFSSSSLVSMTLSFFGSVFGGILCGAIVGWLSSLVTKFFDDHLLEMTLTVICAYGSFLLAEQLQVSPVLAVLTAGILVGNLGSHLYMTATTRAAVDAFWEYAAFIVNSMVFLLIGLQINLPLLAKYAPLIGAGILALLASRALVVYLFGLLIPTKDLPLPWSWRHILFWGALRGSLSMALVLSLPLSFPAREPIIVVTFGVTLFTLLVQGLTVEPIIHFLKLNNPVAIKSEGEIVDVHVN